jgi:RNA polymerase sigma-70 factor (ECF subfamily)
VANLAIPQTQSAPLSELNGERALVLRAKAMEEAAWDELLSAYYPRLTAYLRQRVGDAIAAEDLASEVFTQAVERIDRYEWRGLPFGAWLFRIARNLSVDYLRRRQRAERVRPVALPDPPDMQRRVEQSEEAAEVQRAMLALTLEQREVITLRFINEFSIREAAHVMRKSEGAVKAIQFRALGALRRMLARGDGERPEVNNATQG